MLVVLSYAFRAPALLNADATNSDAAIVGLQAQHILHGEFSAFLWGSGYQTSVDAFCAAAFFALLGATPIALMMTALTLHVVATLFVYFALASTRALGPLRAFVLSLFLVFTASSVHSYALYPPRQASLTLAMIAFALWLRELTREGQREGQRDRSYRAAFVYALALFADPYPLVLFPAAFVMAAAVAHRREHRKRAAAAQVAAFALGVVPFVLLRMSPRAASAPLSFSLSVIPHNASLLWNECLPWALSIKTYYAQHVMDYAPWAAPVWFTAFAVVAALTLMPLLGSAVVLARNAALPFSLRATSVAGVTAVAAALFGFLTSVMVMDHFSMRYLAVVTLVLPFTLAALAKRVTKTKHLAIAAAPFLVSSAVGGWVGFGPFVRGAMPVVASTADDDEALLRVLSEHDLHYAMADYWTAYRLTLLSRERVVFVPKNEGEDRYRPYRSSWERAPAFAYVFDPGRSRESKADIPTFLAGHGALTEQRTIGALTVYFVKRAEN